MTERKPEGKSVAVNGLQLHYLDWGTAGKPPLLCLHGHTGQARIWDEFAEAIAPYYHVYAIDQRGHGASQRAADYDRLRYVEDLGALIEALALPKVTLVGLSMGGWNSLLYTPDHQERVERIILVDIGPESSEAQRELQRNRPPTPLEFATFDDAFCWTRLGNPWASDDRIFKELNDKMCRLSDGTWVWQADQALFNSKLRDTTDPELTARYWSSLEAITCPILLVRGKGSLMLSNELVERMTKANPRLSAVDVPDAGHVVPVDQPEAFIQATRGFLGVNG